MPMPTAIHALITEHLAEGHLLPRDLDDIRVACHRFVVATQDGRLVGCAELAPLSSAVSEIRSLVVSGDIRGLGLGTDLIQRLVQRATDCGFEKLCAFTHRPSYFVQSGFSIVPHVWLPEKIVTDCHACPHFRRCGQYAVLSRARRRNGAFVPWLTLMADAGASVLDLRPSQRRHHGARGIQAGPRPLRHQGRRLRRSTWPYSQRTRRVSARRCSPRTLPRRRRCIVSRQHLRSHRRHRASRRRQQRLRQRLHWRAGTRARETDGRRDGGGAWLRAGGSARRESPASSASALPDRPRRHGHPAGRSRLIEQVAATPRAQS